MPRVMTVDDSRAVRNIVLKQLQTMGCEVDEAEDGEQALAKLQDIAVDLILLDVTMPVMDGPTMLAKLRAGGNQTPVIMLTSESKKSIIGDAVAQGIDDYILKPFKPEELAVKVRKSLRLGAAPAAGGGAAAVVDTAPAAAPAASVGGGTGELAEGKQFIDLLVIDDMENVIKKVRSIVPEHVSVHGVTSGQAALAASRDRVCRVALIDYELPDVNAALLASQLKMLQPHAALIAMMVRTQTPANDLLNEAKAKGFSDVLFKPFNQESIEDLLLQYFDRQDTISREDNVLKVSAFSGKPERLDRYFSRLATLIAPELQTIASACFEGVVIDLSKAPPNAEKLPRLMAQVGIKAKEMGLSVCLVGPNEVRDVLKVYEETKTMPIFAAVAEARAEVG